jgi:poly(A) polymerase
LARSDDPILARLSATSVVRVLVKAGHRALFAGGCVRDELLGIQPTDYDVATSATPQQVRQLFPRVHEVGEAFGVMLVPIRTTELHPIDRAALHLTPSHTQQAVIEVATFRTDGHYEDKRRPSAVQFADAPQDAQRRDFTVNALFLDPLATALRDVHEAKTRDDQSPPVKLAKSPLGGVVIDYVGGLADLAGKTLRAVGTPSDRLSEDHLRALRAIRFTSRLGFTLEEATARAVKHHASQLVGVSRERIGEEVRRMTRHHSAPAALALIEQLGLDDPVLRSRPTDEPLSRTRPGFNCVQMVARRQPPWPGPWAALPRHETDWMSAILAAWMLDRLAPPHTPLVLDEALQAAIVKQLRTALCLTNDERDGLAAILSLTAVLSQQWDSLSIASRKRLAVARSFVPALRCLAAHDQARSDVIAANVQALCDDGIGLQPQPLIDGDGLTALGLKPGPIYKTILYRLYDQQLEGQLVGGDSPQTLSEVHRRALALFSELSGGPSV